MTGPFPQLSNVGNDANVASGAAASPPPVPLRPSPGQRRQTVPPPVPEKPEGLKIYAQDDMELNARVKHILADLDKVRDVPPPPVPPRPSKPGALRRQTVPLLSVPERLEERDVPPPPVPPRPSPGQRRQTVPLLSVPERLEERDVPPPPVPEKPEGLKIYAQDDMKLNARVGWILEDPDVRFHKGKEPDVPPPPPPVPSREEVDLQEAREVWAAEEEFHGSGPSMPPSSDIVARRADKQAELKEMLAERSANSWGRDGNGRD